MLRDYATLILLLGATAIAIPMNDMEKRTMAKNFTEADQVPTSADLKWTPCYENFTCANLEVPLDYTNPSIGTTNVAFIKSSALQQPAKGDILINPGGPGQSGVNYVVTFQLYLQRTLGPNFNIIGMDPRGINNSGPNLDCFEDNPAARDYYDQHYYMYDPTSNFSMAEHFEASGGFGDWCSQSLTREANYANTPATARDMLQYIEKLAESRGEDSKEAKLNYYGISYGSALGTTYATLFPDRVGHMIIDGVVDVTDYYGGSWTQNLLLADEAVKSFFQYCFNAGPLCNFFKNDTSPEAIGKRFNAVLDDIDTSPVPVTDKAVVDFPTVITSVDVRYFLLMAIYDSVTIFPIFASVLADLELRNGSSMIDLLKMVSLPKGLMPKASCDWEGPSYCDIQPKLLVACNDQDGRYNISTLEKWHEYVTELKGISNYVGEVWAAVITLQCRSLQFSPPETQKFYGFNLTTTSNPILFTQNRVDPVASSAHKMSSFFPGSVVLTQDVVGHGLQAAQSDCIDGHLQTFLVTGELPPADTTCGIKYQPFEVHPIVV